LKERVKVQTKHRVVIVGGGFGGLYAAQALRRAPLDVTVIDRRNFHLFQPLLYQVATGSLSPGDIAAPIRSVLGDQRNTRVLLGTVSDFDPAGQRVFLEEGEAFEYDSLIVAAGSQSSYFGHDDWREFAPSLKTVEEATAIRHKILYAFEAAEREPDPELRRAWLTFVIVGAGATGVELAGAMGEIARHTLQSEFRSIRPEEAKILILDGSTRVLPAYPEDLSRKAEQALIGLGVRVRSGVRVTGVNRDGVTFLANGATDRLLTKTVLWAAGVTASPLGKVLADRTGAVLDRTGKLKVNPDLTLPGHPEIFVVGDLALINDGNGNPLPGVAQVAIQSGSYAANAIVKRLKGETNLKPFAYFNKGDIAVIGRAAAVANVFGVHVSGLLAWLIWLFIHLMYIVEFRSRIIVFIQWGFQYMTFSRGARLITGPTVGEPEV
jgi:NADH:ubiquinone reductase (H+-translocating)